MQAAWVVFAQGRVYLDVPDFKKILPLMGEDVPEDEASRGQQGPMGGGRAWEAAWQHVLP